MSVPICISERDCKIPQYLLVVSRIGVSLSEQSSAGMLSVYEASVEEELAEASKEMRQGNTNSAVCYLFQAQDIVNDFNDKYAGNLEGKGN